LNRNKLEIHIYSVEINRQGRKKEREREGGRQSARKSERERERERGKERDRERKSRRYRKQRGNPKKIGFFAVHNIIVACMYIIAHTYILALYI
jgi:hypothetical protein